MSALRFWYSESDQVLHVINVSTEKKKQLKKEKEIAAFLDAYELALSELCGVYEVGDDRTLLFRRKWLG